GLPSRDAPQPVHRRALSTSKPVLVLPSHPRCEGLIEMPQDLEKLRPVKPTVVVLPAPHRRVECSSQIFQALVVPGRCHPPFADGLPDRLGGLGADRWQEAHEELPPAILRPSRPRKSNETCSLFPRRSS